MIQLKGGFVTSDPRLDRIPEFDPASRGYQIRETLETVKRRRRGMRYGPTLDQGREGACVGFSCIHSVAARPIAIKKPPATNELARETYFLAQQKDHWPGGEYPGASPRYAGSSVLGGMKALQEKGFIREYRWVGAGSQTPIDDVRDTLRFVGQVVFGTYWYPSMFNVRPDGILEVDATARPAGGHAYAGVDAVWKKLPGTDKRREYIVIQNSWGLDWGVTYRGQGGFAYVKVEDIETLLMNQGEGAVPIKP